LIRKNSSARWNAVGGFLRAPVRLALGLSAAAAVAAVTGCSDDGNSPAPSNDVVAVTMAPDTLLFPAIGATISVAVTARFEDSQESDITLAPSTSYSSSDPTIAGIGGGIVSAAGAGAARVAVAFGGASDTGRVIVDESMPLPLDSLRASPSDLVLFIDETRTLRAEAIWANGARLDAAGVPFAYSSSNEDVVRVSASGEVRAVSGGTAEITVSYRGLATDVAVSVFPEERVVFDRDIFPILFARCALPQCHPGALTLTAQRDLRLNNFESVMRGGVNGPIVVPGEPEASRLFLAVRGVLPGTRLMPLGGVLRNADIGLIEDWIEQGACRTSNDCPDIGGEDANARMR